MHLSIDLSALIISYINHNNIDIFDYIIKTIKNRTNKSNINTVNSYFTKNKIPVNTPMKSFSDDFVLVDKINYDLPICTDMIKKLIIFYFINLFDYQPNLTNFETINNQSYYSQIESLNTIAMDSNFSYLIVILLADQFKFSKNH